MEPISYSSEYAAVQHILAAPRIASRTAPYIGEDDFDWTRLRAETETMSHSEALLVHVADELWNAEKRTGLWEIARRLDDGHFERVLAALRIHRQEPLSIWLFDEPEAAIDEQRAA
jgi:ABC-type transport system involved in cytochrome c biogenesis ATPase subunit